MLKAIFMDYTGTTVQENGAQIQEVVTQLCKNSSLHDPKEMLKVWWTTTKELEDLSYGESYITEEEILDRILEKLVKEYEFSGDCKTITELIKEFWADAPLFEDAGIFLEKCALPVYILTNNGKQYIERSMQKKGLKPAGIISADEVKAYKPHREVFEYALRVAGCRPEEVVHIGDSYQSDVQGARSAGIRPVLVSRNGQKTYEEDLMVVKSLVECLDL